MIYFYTSRSKIGDKEVELQRPLCSSTGDVLIHWLKSAERFSAFKSMFPKAKFIWVDGEASPSIAINGDITDGVEVSNVTKLYNIIVQHLDENGNLPAIAEEKLIMAFAKPLRSNEVASLLVQASKFEHQSKKNLCLSAPCNFNRADMGLEITPSIVKRVEEHNNLFKAASSGITFENTTLNQKSETDELFIAIPDARILAAEQEIDWGKFLPKMSTVFTPYSEPEAYLPKYRDYVPKYLIKRIEGDPSKNRLGIQPNEQRYYDALCTWVRTNMKNDFGSDDGDVIDSLSKSYLTELAFRLYSRNWGHNSNVPEGFIGLDDEEDVENSTSIDSRFVFTRDLTSEENCFDNALVYLENFLKSASAILGWKVYVEAVIRLARWGERKGTALVFEGMKNIFDLGTNQVKMDIGNIDDYKLQKIDGNEYSFVAWIVPSIEAQDVKLKGADYTDVPIGIVLSSKFVNRDTELEVLSYYSMFDAIPLIKSRKLLVNGISDDLKVTVTPKVLSIDSLLRDYQRTKDTFLQNPFVSDECVKRLFLECNIVREKEYQSLLLIFDQAMKNSVFIDEVKQNKLIDLDDLKSKAAELKIIPQTALEVNIAAIMLPLVESVSKSEKSILEAWEDALTKWKGVNSFWTGTSGTLRNPEAFKQPNALHNSNEQKTAVQSQNNQNASGSALTAVPVPAQVVTQVPPSAKIIKIIDDNGNVVGGYAAIPTNRKIRGGGYILKLILLSEGELKEISPDRFEKEGLTGTESTGETSIRCFIPRMVDCFLDLHNGKSTRLAFASVDSMKYYKEVFKRLFMLS